MAVSSAELKNVDAALNRLRFGGYTAVKIKDTSDKVLFQYGQDEDNPGSASEVLEVVSNFFSDYDGGRFLIEAKPGAGPKFANRVISFMVNLNPATASINGMQTTAAGIGAMDIMQQLYEQKFENALLKMQMERKESDSAGIFGNPMIQQLIQSLAPAIIGKFLGGSVPAVAGATAGTAAHIEQTEAEFNDRIALALNSILEVDPEFLPKLEKIAAFAKNNPEKFKNGFVQILSML